MVALIIALSRVIAGAGMTRLHRARHLVLLDRFS
jgi:hypothetical protein